MGGVKIKIKDHLSLAEADVGAELGNKRHSIMLERIQLCYAISIFCVSGMHFFKHFN